MRYIVIPVEQVTQIAEILHFSHAVGVISGLVPDKIKD